MCLKKFVCLFFVFVMLFSLSCAYCSDSIKIYYNKKHITCDVEAFIENSRTLIPVVLLNQMGYKTEWNEKKQTVTITNSDKKIILTIGSSIAMVDGVTIKMDAKAKIVSSRTFVPIRFISENFGYKVSWDGETKSVYISEMGIMITNMDTDRENDVFLIKLEADSEIKNVENNKLCVIINE